MKLVRTYLLPLLFLLTVPSWLLAGNEQQPAGARRAALGFAYTGIRGDLWSMWANPAGIAGIGQMEVGAFFERRFLLSELNSGAIGFVTPFKEKHYAGLSVSGFGFGGYNETMLGLNYATTVLERLSIGATVNYARTSITNYGARGTVFVNAGLNAIVTKELSVGFRIFNANQAEIVRETDERVPTTLDLGLAYQVTDKVLLVADVQKQVNYPVSYRGGVEYAFLKNFVARVGASTQPVTFNAGIGLSLDAFDVDFTNSFHEYVGYTPSLSLNYRFGSKSSEE